MKQGRTPTGRAAGGAGSDEWRAGVATEDVGAPLGLDRAGWGDRRMGPRNVHVATIATDDAGRMRLLDLAAWIDAPTAERLRP